MPVVTGASLKHDIDTLQVTHIPLVEGLIYQGHVSFIAGEPGGGKSILATQLALSLTCGGHAFGSLPIAVPRRVYYLQLEGSYPDTIDRMRRMSTKIAYNPNNLGLDFRTGLNLLDMPQATALMEAIESWGQPDLLVVDPLYQAVFGELSAELPTKALLRFIDVCRARFTTLAILLIHHTRKPSYSADGQRVKEDDPFYGSQWLKAYVDCSFLLRQPEVGKYKDHVFLVNKKDRYSVASKEILLHYDPETDTVSTDAPYDEQSPYERVIKYIANCKAAGKTTHFFDVIEHTQISVRHLRRVTVALVEKGYIRCGNYEGHKRIWHPL